MSNGFRVSLILGFGLSAAAGAVFASEPPSPQSEELICDLPIVGVNLATATTKAAAHQWVSKSEAARAEKPVLPEITSNDWLPAKDVK